MTRCVAITILIAAITIVVVCAIAQPSYISDKNDFMHHFVNHELLALLGIIMTITLASAANLHLEFNKIEERYKSRGLTTTRRGVVQGAYALIFLFLLAIIIVVIKPLLPHSETAEALFNGTAVIIVLFNVLVLLDMTQLAFAIKPQLEE